MKRAFLDSASYLVAFVAIQFAVQLTALFVCQTHDMTPTVTTAVALVSGVAAIALFAWRRWTPCNGSYINTRPWATALWAALLAVGLLTPLAYANEVLGIEMPAEYIKLFNGMMQSDLGFFTVGIVVPVAEEMVFRGAILRRLDEALGHRLRWLSITVTALLFAVVHGNLAQGVGAFIMGLPLGWAYIRTRSIVPGIVMHWTNNSIAVLVYRLMPGTADMTLTEFFGGDMKRVAAMLAFSLMVAGASLFQLNLRLHRPRHD